MRRASTVAITLALVLTCAGFRGCDPAQKKSVEQNVTAGLRVTARAVEPGIDAMRALREAGEVDSVTNLSLAKSALEVNSVAKRLTQAALDGADSEDLRGQLDALVKLAEGLERDGTLRLKSGKTKLIFSLGIIAARNGLSIASDEFKAGGGMGLSFTLDADTRKSLEDLKPLFDKNDGLLRDAIVRLERM